MAVAKIIQILWAVPLALLMGLTFIHHPTAPNGIRFAVAAVLLLCVVGCLKNIRQCWIPTIVICLWLIYRWLPMVLYNYYLMYAVDDPLYHESPGTGFVVDLYAVMFVIPPLIILGSLCADAKRLLFGAPPLATNP